VYFGCDDETSLRCGGALRNLCSMTLHPLAQGMSSFQNPTFGLTPQLLLVYMSFREITSG